MLHFGEIPKKIGKIWWKFSKILAKFAKFWEKTEKNSAIFNENFEIRERCKGVHCVDLGESFPTSIYLQNLASIQPRTSLVKFARSPRTDPPGHQWGVARNCRVGRGPGPFWRHQPHRPRSASPHWTGRRRGVLRGSRARASDESDRCGHPSRGERPQAERSC